MEQLLGIATRLKPLWFLLAVGHAGFIYWTSDQTWEGASSNLPSGVSNLVHFPLYGILGGFLFFAIHSLRKPGISYEVWVWALVLGFGIFDEFHQAGVPGRSFSVWDMVTDGAGAVFATSVLTTVIWGRQPASKPLILGSFLLALLSSFIFPHLLPNF